MAQGKIRQVVGWNKGLPSSLHIGLCSMEALNAFDALVKENEGKDSDFDSLEFYSRGNRRKRKIFRKATIAGNGMDILKQAAVLIKENQDFHSGGGSKGSETTTGSSKAKEDPKESQGALNASAAAVELAQAKGIDLSGISGTGKDGLITKGDVEKLG